MEFKLDEVMNNLNVVCRAYPGNADQHDFLKMALNGLYERCKRLEELEAKSDDLVKSKEAVETPKE